MKIGLNGLIVLGMVITVMTGCKKYNEGGLVSKSEKRLTANEWKLDKYFRNGIDETSQLLITNFTEAFAENSKLTRYYFEEDGDEFLETGSWSFDNNKQEIKIKGVGSIELTEETSTVSSSDYKILKLTKEELWYQYENGGDYHEFHLLAD